MLAIIWHSRTGAAEAMATAAYAGCGGVEGARALLIPAAQVTPEEMLAASGYLFVCPENLGAVTGVMKEMFDTSYYPLLGKVEGRPYACAIAAGSDGSGALRQIERIVTGWRLRRVAEPLLVNLGAQSEAAILAPKHILPADRERCHQLGALLAEGMDLGVF